MPTKKIKVKKYRRFKNNRWENVVEHEREIETTRLSDIVLKDIREGKAIKLETEEGLAEDWYIGKKIENEQEFKAYWTLMSQNERMDLILYIADGALADFEAKHYATLPADTLWKQLDFEDWTAKKDLFEKTNWWLDTKEILKYRSRSEKGEPGKGILKSPKAIVSDEDLKQLLYATPIIYRPDLLMAIGVPHVDAHNISNYDVDDIMYELGKRDIQMYDEYNRRDANKWLKKYREEIRKSGVREKKQDIAEMKQLRENDPLEYLSKYVDKKKLIEAALSDWEGSYPGFVEKDDLYYAQKKAIKEDPLLAIENYDQDTLKNIIGQIEIDEDLDTNI